MADRMELVISNLISKNKYTHILATNSSAAKDYLPRAASSFDCQPLSDIISIIVWNQPIYAGNAITTVESHDKHKFLNIRVTNFDSASSDIKEVIPIEKLNVEEIFENAPNKDNFMQFVSETFSEGDLPELSSAKVVVSGGRALKSKENFELLYKLCKVIDGATVGASRAAVDAGYVPNDLQVGQTGVIVAPELYIAIGISGAIQHVAGMKDSKIIVAINKDADSPIFKIANYGLVGDLFKIIPELTQKLGALKK